MRGVHPARHRAERGRRARGGDRDRAALIAYEAIRFREAAPGYGWRHDRSRRRLRLAQRRGTCRAGAAASSAGAGWPRRAALFGEERPLCLLLLPAPLEEFELRERAEDLLTAPGVAAVDPPRLSYARRRAAGRGVRRRAVRPCRRAGCGCPGIPRALVVFDPLQYPLARALRDHPPRRRALVRPGRGEPAGEREQALHDLARRARRAAFRAPRRRRPTRRTCRCGSGWRRWGSRAAGSGSERPTSASVALAGAVRIFGSVPRSRSAMLSVICADLRSLVEPVGPLGQADADHHALADLASPPAPGAARAGSSSGPSAVSSTWRSRRRARRGARRGPRRAGRSPRAR